MRVLIEDNLDHKGEGFIEGVFLTLDFCEWLWAKRDHMREREALDLWYKYLDSPNAQIGIQTVT